MTARTIMTTDLVTVSTDATVADALLAMSRHQVNNIPVVDTDGSFVGLVSLRWLTHELLPTASRLDDQSFQMPIGFVTDTSDRYLQRLREIGQRPVGEFLEKKKKLRFCSPDTPIPRLLQLLSENPTSLPVLVLEGKKKRVVGMVSNWDVLTKIAIAMLPEGSEQEGAGEPGPADEPPGS